MAIDILAPAEQTVPVVFASPHSGHDYPPDFVAASRLDALALRRSEDAFVDEIFAAAPAFGAPLLRATFPRAYVDVNREPFELDPAMFRDPLPAYVNTDSPRVAAGFGTLARVVTNGEEIYADKLGFDEARHRIETCYRPYHDALEKLLESARRRFGWALLVDCHSMPSTGGPTDRDAGARRVDVVLGDRHGTSCAGAIIRNVDSALKDMGFRVARNNPYAGGFTTRHYGQPATSVHVLQIEINRALYMDEERIVPTRKMPALVQAMTRLIRTIVALRPEIEAAAE